MRGEEVRDATMSAVAEAVEEAGFKEPLQGRAQPVDASGTKSAPDGGDESGDDAKPSHADLAEIDKDPRARELYRRMSRGFHGRMAQIAEADRETQTARQAVEAIRRDPVAAARAFASAAGLRIEGDAGPQTLLDRAQRRMAKEFGPEAAAIMAPVFLQIAEEAVKESIGPVTEHMQQQRQLAEHSQIKQGISAFAAHVVEDGGTWDEETELEMAALVRSGKVHLGQNANLAEYLDMLHSQVTARRARAARRAPAAERGSREDGGAIRAGMDPRDAARIAVAAAKREVGRR